MRLGLMRIIVDWSHVTLLLQYARLWLLYVLGLVFLGWSFGPRLDEVVFVALLPIPFVIAYAAGCLAVAWLRVLMAGGGAAAPGSDTQAPPLPPAR